MGPLHAIIISLSGEEYEKKLCRALPHSTFINMRISFVMTIIHVGGFVHKCIT